MQKKDKNNQHNFKPLMLVTHLLKRHSTFLKDTDDIQLTHDFGMLALGILFSPTARIPKTQTNCVNVFDSHSK